MIAGLIIGGIVGLVVGAAGGVFLYRCYEKAMEASD